MHERKRVYRSGLAATLCALALLVLQTGVPYPSEALERTPMRDTVAAGDTITVEGQVVVVGNEPFTRMRVIEKGGGGYILTFEDGRRMDLRRQGPTFASIVGIPYEDSWQGTTTPHLRVVRWQYGEE